MYLYSLTKLYAVIKPFMYLYQDSTKQFAHGFKYNNISRKSKTR